MIRAFLPWGEGTQRDRPGLRIVDHSKRSQEAMAGLPAAAAAAVVEGQRGDGQHAA